MLRITIAETNTEVGWTLEGSLDGPWVGELRSSWKKSHSDHSGRTSIVDLSEVTFIDRGGERLLRTMLKEGAQFIVADIYTKHVFKQSCTRRDREGAKLCQPKS
jgi:anti-anti-sigma regulatory factor